MGRISLFGVVFLLVYLLNWLVRAYVVLPVKISDQAMEPNIAQGDRIFFSLTSDRIHRNDVVYIRSVRKGVELVCRVIVLPGESIEIKDQKVYINSEKQTEKYPVILNKTSLPHEILVRDNYPLSTIKQDHYFCLFDNRGFLNDSRSWGAFSKQEIFGVAHSKGLLGKGMPGQ